MEWLVLLACLAQVTPGDAYAAPNPGLVLRAGPSQNHPGVLTLRATDVVRFERSDAALARVYVARGFPVYVHGDYAEIDPAQQRVHLRGRRVNLRLLPCTDGLLPVGQAGEEAGPLVFLDREGDWVRVLAPVGTALYAPPGELRPLSESDGAGAWRAAFAERDRRRLAAVSAWKATDPGWQASQQVERELTTLAQIDLQSLTDGGLAAHRSALDGLLARATLRSTRSQIETLTDEVAAELQSRQAALSTLEEVKRQQAREAASLVREARVLDLGLRFLEKGEAMTLRGTVTRRTSEDQDVAVYSIKAANGQSFKLSAAPEIADLKQLLGARVDIEGRSLPLVNVSGPVLIVDKVTRLP